MAVVAAGAVHAGLEADHVAGFRAPANLVSEAGCGVVPLASVAHVRVDGFADLVASHRGPPGALVGVVVGEARVVKAHGFDVHVPAVAHDEFRAQRADGRTRVAGTARGGVLGLGQVDDPSHVVLGLREGRYAAVFQDAAEARVVGGEVSWSVSPVSFPNFLAVSTCEARPHM